jgi:hypothetical protein
MIPFNSQSYQDAIATVDLSNTYIKQAFDYYHQCFLASNWACMFVESSPLIPEDLREHSYPCLCNRSLGSQVGSRRTLQGGAMRGALLHNNLLLRTGGELFRGCIVFPEMDDAGIITSAVGYRYGKRIRSNQAGVIQWQRPDANHYVTQGMLTIKEMLHEKAHF